MVLGSWVRRVATIALLIISISKAAAQQRGDYSFDDEWALEPTEMLEVDTTLFRPPTAYNINPYGEATRYYLTPASTRRRGLYYTTAEAIIEPTKPYKESLSEPTPQSGITLYSAQSSYRAGLRATHADLLHNGWSLNTSLWMQTGRDMFVEGVFSNTAIPNIELQKRFSHDKFLTIKGSLYASSRGVQFGSTAEAFELTGNNFYNPTWGFYNGEVRNSRVNRTLSPELSLHYQQPISHTSTLILEGDAQYRRRANSSLSWYDATTPMPDYYRSMPSFMPDNEAKEHLTNLWRLSDPQYTQVAWDDLFRINSFDGSKSAYYAIEDRVYNSATTTLTAVVESEIGEQLTLTYGAEYRIESSRNFKIMNDLLGASHLLDYDIFIGDNYNKTTPLQNNMLEPDHKIFEGDRFGYDYSIDHSRFDAILQARYRTGRFDIDIDATIGSESYQRHGYYEKERFAGGNSFGNSSAVTLSPYMVRTSIGYVAAANRYFALELLSTQLSPLSRNLFLSEMSANFLAPTISSERINSATLSFNLNHPTILLSAEIYALQSGSGTSTVWLYDDLSATMARGIISNIGYCSYGAEIAAQLSLHHDLKLSATLAAGQHFYDCDPLIELYDDASLQLLSAATPSRMSGVYIGNTPQMVASLSATYFGLSRYIFNLNASYAAARYEQPSFARRSERLLTQAFVTPESSTAALEQKQLGDIFDIELSAMHFIYLDNDDRVSIRVAVANLLGDNNRVSYAKESDRILVQKIDGNFTGAEMRQSTMQYDTPRTIKISVGYMF